MRIIIKSEEDYQICLEKMQKCLRTEDGYFIANIEPTEDGNFVGEMRQIDEMIGDQIRASASHLQKALDEATFIPSLMRTDLETSRDILLTMAEFIDTLKGE